MPSRTASFQRIWEVLRCSIYDHRNEKLLRLHIIIPHILTCKARNRFQGSFNVKYFKVKERLESLLKVEAYLEPKPASIKSSFVNLLNGLLFSQ